VNIGFLLTLLAFAATLIYTFSFLLGARGQTRFLSLGRIAYRYFVYAVSVASLLLLYYFLSGDYSYRYVFEYSSSDLSFFYLISAFWAGQRGTYLLWLLLLALLGYYLLRRGRQYTSYAMFFQGLINLFFGIMLLVLSPFEKLPVPQPDGAGLNPLLKDPWMVVHPPIIFLGYAAVALPCVIALAALVKKNYKDWVTVSFAPAALGAMALAAGNIMGGFWAYKTLGWGGYWSWDPVENSSFIPWMTSLALIHGLLIERTRGSLRKTNLFLALFTFSLVVYGTFLTRSGVLADFSVHSFVDLGVNIYLIVFMIGFLFLSLLIYLYRIPGIKGPAIEMTLTSRDFVLLVSMWVLLLIALLVLSGTSWPLLSTMFGQPSTVDVGVYTRVTFPLAVVIGLFLGFSPFLGRSELTLPGLMRKIVLSALVALAATVSAFLIGVRDVSYLIFIFFIFLAVVSNLQALLRAMPSGYRMTAAYISHFGFALMLLGILGSSAYASSTRVVIDRGQTERAFDYEITYKGMAGDITDIDNEIILSITDNGDRFEARPGLYWAQRMNGLMKKPHIRRHFAYDLYLAPEQIQELDEDKGQELSKGRSVEISGLSVTFLEFRQESHTTGGMMNFGAKIEIVDPTGGADTVIPAIEYTPDRQIKHHDAPVMTGGDSLSLRLEKIFADEGAVLVSFGGLADSGPENRLVLEVSRKPTMNILWAGAILVVLGGLVSLEKRWRRTS